MMWKGSIKGIQFWTFPVHVHIHVFVIQFLPPFLL